MTTRRSMTVEDHIRQALEFLDHSDREFEAGDELQGSEKLWGAASHAVMAAAKKRGWRFSKYNARVAAVHTLAAEKNDDSLFPSFQVARHFHSNFYHDVMEDIDIANGRPVVHAFVHRIIAIAEEPAP